MSRPTMDTLLADEIGPRLAIPDVPRLSAITGSPTISSPRSAGTAVAGSVQWNVLFCGTPLATVCPLNMNPLIMFGVAVRWCASAVSRVMLVDPSDSSTPPFGSARVIGTRSRRERGSPRRPSPRVAVHVGIPRPARHAGRSHGPVGAVAANLLLQRWLPSSKWSMTCPRRRCSLLNLRCVGA